MMMYSPSQFISSKTRLLLSETLKNEGEEHLKQLLNSLNFVFSGDSSRIPDKFQLLINLMSLTLYSGLPEFYRKVVRYGGLRILFTFVRWWLQNASHIELCLISHLKVTAIDRTCCRIGIEEWEGKEVHLIMILLSLAELMNSYESEDHEFDIFARNSTYTKDQFIRDIQNISLNTTSNGVKWYCSYVLSFFGFYGFPDKLGSRVSSIFDKDHGDISLILRDGQSINVHQVILLIRCPSLLPRCGPSNEEKMCRSNSDISVKEGIEKCQRTMIKVNLSSQVDYQALSRLLDFVYSGFLQADRGVLRNLRIIAKYCNIQPLVRLLCRKRPKWGAHVPCFDLTGALGPDGHVYS